MRRTHRTHRTHRTRRTCAVTTLVVLLLAVPVAASAHPAFNPSELPPGEAVESKLVVPHGCAPGGGMPETAEEGGAAEPTVELALQHTEGITVEPGDIDGWQVTDDGEAWVWSDDGGATTDVIEFPVRLTIDAGVTAGEELYLRAFQECADGSSFQWVGTPDEEASFPAVRLTATDGGVGTVEPSEDVGMDHGEMEMDEDDEDMTGSQDDAATDEEPDEDMTAADTPSEETPDEVAVDEEQAGTEDGGLPTGLLVALALVAVAAVAGLVMRSRTS